MLWHASLGHKQRSRSRSRANSSRACPCRSPIDGNLPNDSGRIRPETVTATAMMAALSLGMSKIEAAFVSVIDAIMAYTTPRLKMSLTGGKATA